MIIVSYLDRTVKAEDGTVHELRSLLINKFEMVLAFINEDEARFYMKNILKIPDFKISSCFFIKTTVKRKAILMHRGKWGERV